MAASSLGASTPSWSPLKGISEKGLPRLGTITRYRTIMDDDIEREVIHGRALDALKPAGRSVDLTIGTAPPLSQGPEGMIMHFLLKNMELGVDGVIFGPELSLSDQTLDVDARRRIAGQVGLPNSAHAFHHVANRLSVEADVDLRHMLWSGISLGAMKGILFAAMAPSHDRTVVYSHFVAPLCPNPTPPSSEQELRKFILSELVVRRGFGLVGQGGSSSSDFGDDLLCRGVPHERFRVVVPVRRPQLDRFGEGGDGVEAAGA